MPSLQELNYYLDHIKEIKRPDLDKTLNLIHRVTTARKSWKELFIFAFDHRKQLEEMANSAGRSQSDISTLKQLFVKAVIEITEENSLSGKVGVLIDDTYGQEALNHATGRNWWIARPVELPGSRPLEFEHGENIGQLITTWPKEHIVKCLLFYHPDDETSLRQDQEKHVRQLYEACLMSGHELLLEIISPAHLPDDETAIPRAIERFYQLEIFPDWWKLKPPGQSSWQKINHVIKTKAVNRPGIVLLGLDRPEDELAKGFEDAKGNELCHGFAIGRTIFSKPASDWLSKRISDEILIQNVKDNYLKMIRIWKNNT